MFSTSAVAHRVVATAVFLAACTGPDNRLSEGDRAAIADEIKQRVVSAYDLSKPNAVERLMALYPARGPVYSAGAGSFTASRDSLQTGIRAFWENVGRNMRSPQWIWTAMVVDVLSPSSAVMTATYRVPHRTPDGRAHELAGAWTAAFAKRGGEWVIVHEHLSDAPSVSDTVRADSRVADPHAGH